MQQWDLQYHAPIHVFCYTTSPTVGGLPGLIMSTAATAVFLQATETSSYMMAGWACIEGALKNMFLPLRCGRCGRTTAHTEHHSRGDVIIA